MAKQRGLHQIKGKVGEHSYYSQTGVSGGLIRSINQGLSARVKTDAAYANTRLNNVEFGGACAVAGALGAMVVPKFRPMILPFSQSNMAKKVLELARANGGSWGQRVVTAADTPELAEILSEQSKRNSAEFVTLIANRVDASTLTVGFTYTGTQATHMSDLGINGISIKAAQVDLATGKYVIVGGAGRINKSYIRMRKEYQFDEIVTAGADNSGSEDISVSSFTPTAELYNGHQLVVFLVMPTRDINGTAHVLQEYCSFYAMQMPAA